MQFSQRTVLLNRKHNTLVLFIDCTHQLRRRWEHLIHEDEDGFLWCKLNPFPDDVHKLANRQVLSEGCRSVKTAETAQSDAERVLMVPDISSCRWWGCQSGLLSHI